MDSVEQAMALEETFDISIPDDCAERIITVGDLQCVVLERPQVKGTPQNPHDIFEDLARIIVEVAGVAPGRIAPDAWCVDDLGIDQLNS